MKDCGCAEIGAALDEAWAGLDAVTRRAADVPTLRGLVYAHPRVAAARAAPHDATICPYEIAARTPRPRR